MRRHSWRRERSSQKGGKQGGAGIRVQWSAPHPPEQIVLDALMAFFADDIRLTYVPKEFLHQRAIVHGQLEKGSILKGDRIIIEGIKMQLVVGYFSQERGAIWTSAENAGEIGDIRVPTDGDPDGFSLVGLFGYF